MMDYRISPLLRQRIEEFESLIFVSELASWWLPLNTRSAEAIHVKDIEQSNLQEKNQS